MPVLGGIQINEKIGRGQGNRGRALGVQFDGGVRETIESHSGGYAKNIEWTLEALPS